MHAVNDAIHYIAQHLNGPIIVFIDNQATLKSLFTTKPHTAFAMSLDNCKTIGSWLADAPDNTIDFRWMPSHLGFALNELADKLAEVVPIGPPPFPHHMIASRLRLNKAYVIMEWRQNWTAFTQTKALALKKKKQRFLPNAWDGKGKQFIKLMPGIATFSRFTRLVTGHAPTGEFHQRFFPNEPHGCTCFEQFQSQSHLLTECPKYISCFSSMMSFYVANGNTNKIFKYLKDNPMAFTFNDEPIDVYEPP